MLLPLELPSEIMVEIFPVLKDDWLLQQQLSPVVVYAILQGITHGACLSAATTFDHAGDTFDRRIMELIAESERIANKYLSSLTR